MTTLPHEYIQGLYQAGRLSYSYFIDDAENGVIMIDTGMPANRETLEKTLQSMGHTWQDVRHILITHADPDHVGSLGEIVEVSGAEVHASEKSAEYIRNRTVPDHLPLVIKMFRVAQTRLLENLAEVDNTVQDYEKLDLADGIRVIHTPGHTPDHVCYFWEREKVLFAGDLIGNIDNQPGLSPDAVTHDKDALHDSVRRVLALNPRVICPAHGEVWIAEYDPNGLQTLLAKL